MNSSFSRGVSHIAVTAALSVAALIAVSGMQLGKVFATPVGAPREILPPAAAREYLAIEDEDGNGTPDWQDELARSGVFPSATSTVTVETATSTPPDPLSGIGAAFTEAIMSGYLSLAKHDAYTPDRGEQLANTIADNFRAPVTFVPHTVNELSLDTDTSAERALTYRADMRTALAPLITDEVHELTLFAAFIETKDASMLDRISKAAEKYRIAEGNLIRLKIPQDAAPEHLRVTNAMGAYAETLERMIRFGTDPLATIALLRTYNEREREFDLAFDALIKYYARTIGNN